MDQLKPHMPVIDDEPGPRGMLLYGLSRASEMKADHGRIVAVH